MSLTLKELHDIIAEMRIDKVVTTPMNDQERLKDAIINGNKQKDDDSVLQHKSDILRKDGKDQEKK